MKKYCRLINLCLLHFLVDFLTAGTLLRVLLDNDAGYWAIPLYNCLAFLLQPGFGILLDRLTKKSRFASANMLFVTILLLLAGVFSCRFLLPFGVVALGLANAAFHVIGGRDSMQYARHRLTEGLFVSTGALAIGLASLLYVSGPVSSSFALNLPYWLSIPALLLLCLYFLFSALVPTGDLLKGDMEKNEEEEKRRELPKNCLIGLSLSFILLAIFIRSFQGFFAPSSPEISGAYIFFLAVFAFLGKAIGGVALEATGELPLLVFATALGAVSALFMTNPLGNYVFVFASNLLMPLTLDMLRPYFPGHHGFAFGVAASLLVPGWALGQTLKPYFAPWILAVITLVAGGLLVYSSLSHRKAKTK